MSKVICDVCGTTYPETASQCPICGSAKQSADQTAAGGTADSASGGYSYVKGGRFSKRNVRKRNQKGTTAQRRSSGNSRTNQSANKGGKESGNTGLVVVVILLLIAIVSVLIYIGVIFFRNQEPENPADSTGSSQNTQQTKPSETDPPRVACTGVQTLTVIELSEEGETWKLEVELTPVDTTDAVLFESSDPNVATVAEDGTVTAVGPGTADITVTCGDASATCVVHCTIQMPTEPPVIEPFVMEFNTVYRDSTTGLPEVSLNKKGETWRAYKNGMSADPKDVTWIVDNPEICTIENGVVTAVSRGITKIHAQYNGTTYSCIVRCNVPAQTEETDPAGNCTISHTDVTIAVGESFTLVLKDADGNKLDVTWEANDVHVSIEGNKITGVSSGRVIVSVTYEDVTYSCVVYVK